MFKNSGSSMAQTHIQCLNHSVIVNQQNHPLELVPCCHYIYMVFLKLNLLMSIFNQCVSYIGKKKHIFRDLIHTWAISKTLDASKCHVLVLHVCVIFLVSAGLMRMINLVHAHLHCVIRKFYLKDYPIFH